MKFSTIFVFLLLAAFITRAGVKTTETIHQRYDTCLLGEQIVCFNLKNRDLILSTSFATRAFNDSTHFFDKHKKN